MDLLGQLISPWIEEEILDGSGGVFSSVEELVRHAIQGPLYLTELTHISCRPFGPDCF